MSRRSRAQFGLALLFLCCGVCRAGTCDSAEVLIAVQAIKPAPDPFQSSDFRIHLGDLVVPAKVVPNQDPRRIAVLLDGSGSMRESIVNSPRVQEFASVLIHALSPADQVGVFAFSESMVPAVSVGSRREQAQAFIAGLPERLPPTPGRTKLFDALWETLQAAQFARGHVIVAVTDGGDNRSKLKFEQVRDRMVAAGVRFYGVGFYDLSFPNPEEVAGQYDLQRLAEATGGLTVFPGGSDSDWRGHPAKWSEKQRKALASLMKEIADTIDHAYVISIPLPGASLERRRLRVELVDARGKMRKDVYVLHPRWLPPCPAAVDPAQ